MEREGGTTPTNIFVHLQETVRRAVENVLKSPRRIGAQGEPHAYVSEITAETVEHPLEEQVEFGKVMINSEAAARQQKSRR